MSVRIIGNRAWRALSGRTLETPALIVEGCGNVPPHQMRVMPTINASTVLLKDCDNNFVYYCQQDLFGFASM